MKPNELSRLAEGLYGRGWQTRLAEALGVDPSTVRRWVSGAVPVPNAAASALRCFVERAGVRGDLRETEKGV